MAKDVDYKHMNKFLGRINMKMKEFRTQLIDFQRKMQKFKPKDREEYEGGSEEAKQLEKAWQELASTFGLINYYVANGKKVIN